MTNNAGPRHAAQGRASRIAGRTALGVLGAPMAMLAVAGPAGAAALDLDGAFNGEALDLQLAADGLTLPAADSLVSAVPLELPDSLPIDGVAFEGVGLDLFDLGGEDDLNLALPAVGGVALPELPELPAAPDALGTVTGLAAGLPVELPAVGDLALPELPELPDAAGTVTGLAADLPVELPADLPLDVPAVGDLALPELPDLPDAAGTVTDLAAGVPTSAQLDLDDVTATATDALPAAADVFSAAALVSGSGLL